MASPTSSGTWVPPGASRNAKSRREEKRSRTAATSSLEPSVSVIGRFLSRAGTGGRLEFDRITTTIRTSKTFPCLGPQRNGLINNTLDRQEGVLMKSSVI